MRKWSSEQEARALYLREVEKKSYRAIGVEFGRSELQVSTFFRRRRERRAYKDWGISAVTMRKEPMLTPQQVLSDRDRRINAPRTLTMMLFGDPPFEQSALFRMRETA